MAGARSLDHVHGQETDRVDGQLIPRIFSAKRAYLCHARLLGLEVRPAIE